jgi:hypothetical protein
MQDESSFARMGGADFGILSILFIPSDIWETRLRPFRGGEQ